MEQLVRKLQALAGAASLSAFDNESRGLQPLLERLWKQLAEQPLGRRRDATASAVAEAAAARARGPLLPALAAALAAGLRLLSLGGGAAGWAPQAEQTTVPAAVASMAAAFLKTAGIDEHSPPAWPDDATMRLVQQTGLVPLLGDACAALVSVPPATGPAVTRELEAWLYAEVCKELSRACRNLGAFVALHDEQAAPACLRAADLTNHVISTRFPGAAAAAGGGGGGGLGRSGAGAAAGRAGRAVEFATGAGRAAGARTNATTPEQTYRSVLSITAATPGDICLAINAQNKRQEQAAGGENAAIAAPPAPGSFARAILLDPERRFQRLAVAWLSYNLQADMAAVADAGKLADARQRLGPRLATLLEALQLPAAPRAALSCSGQIDPEEALQLLYDYLHNQDLVCEGAGLPLALPLPPTACAPMARVLSGVLGVCRVSIKAERLVVVTHARVVLQMLENEEAVEAATPGWRASVAGALLEACVGKARAGGGAWEFQRPTSSLYVWLADDCLREDCSVAFMEEHAAADPAGFCIVVEAWLRDDGPGRCRCGGDMLLACLKALWGSPNRQATARAAAADPVRLGPGGLSLLLSLLKQESELLRAPGLPPELAASLAVAIATAGHSVWEACRAEGGAAASAGSAARPRSGRTQSLHTDETSWAVLMARALVAAGRAASATAASQGAAILAEEPGAECSAVRAAEAVRRSVPAVCDAVLCQLRACGLPGAWRATEQLQQQSARIAALLAGTAAEGTAAATEESSAAETGSSSGAEPMCTLAQVGAQLELFGVAACAQMPLRSCCNNHDCKSLGAASEAALVKGRSCTGCGAAAYCSKECHKAHWAWHKPMCKALRGC